MTLYVNADAGSAGSGTADHPFSTISEAARLARPGDEVLVFPGIYREEVIPATAGTEEARITYRSAEKGKAVITGAEPVRVLTVPRSYNFCSNLNLFQMQKRRQ